MISQQKDESLILSGLQRAFKSALENRHSAFYRNHFGLAVVPPRFLRRIEDWQEVPFLTRDDIANTPFWQRIFVSREKIINVRPTSGSSGKKIVLIPRSQLPDCSFEKNIGMTSCLDFGSFYQNELSYREEGIITIAGDPEELAMSARLAKLLGIDSIAIQPYNLIALVPYLEKEGLLSDIRIIERFGERMSFKERGVIENACPKITKLYSQYSSMETQGNIGYQCPPLIESKTGWLHPLEERFYVELINIKTGELITEPEKEGELVVTTLREDVAFPLIRYRTGDLAIIRTTHCSCGLKTPVYDILGRVEIDRIRIPRGEINLAEAERAVHCLKDAIDDDFELHYYEKIDGNTVKPYIVFHIVPHSKEVDTVSLAERLSREFRVAPSFSYTDGVTQGLYIPLKITIMKPSTLQRKIRRIRKHV